MQESQPVLPQAQGSALTAPQQTAGGAGLDLAAWVANVQEVTQRAVEIAHVNATSVQQLIAAQLLEQDLALQPERHDQVLQGKDLARLLKQPEKFEAQTRDQEIAGWRTLSWSVEQYLGALDFEFVDLQQCRQIVLQMEHCEEVGCCI